MNEEDDKKLVRAFPLLYGDHDGSMLSTLMCWGFPGSGWFNIIWDLSSKLEPIIQKFIDDNPDLPCNNCGCDKGMHYASKTKYPGRCSAVYVDPDSEKDPPGNYRTCWCERYVGSYPRAAQVKEKFGTLRFYMTYELEEMRAVINEAEMLSCSTCEECGNPGERRAGGWIRTLCNVCHSKD